MSYSTINQIGDNIYANIIIGHDLSQQKSTIAAYAVTKTIPILDKCSDYYASIIRFDIPLDEIPLFIMPIDINDTTNPIPRNPNLTPFIIGIRSKGINFPQNVIYVSNTSYPPPSQNQEIQNITPYYYVFEYQNLIDAVNLALSISYLQSGLNSSNTDCPYFYLDNVTGLINLVANIDIFAPIADAGTPNPIPQATIFMNISLQNYFSAFKMKFIGGENGYQYEFDLVRFGISNNLPPFNNQATDRVFSQEYSVLQSWSSLKKILITTNSIPIMGEYTPTNNSGVSSTFPIISDFTPQIESAGQSRSIAYYVPTSQYRLCDLKSSEQLNTIDIKIYWQDNSQNIYPLIISRFQQASIKIGFFKKSLYNYGSQLLKI